MSPIYKSFTQTHEHTKVFPLYRKQKIHIHMRQCSKACCIVLDYSLSSIEIAMIANNPITMKTPMYGNASIRAMMKKPMKSCIIVEPPCSLTLIVYEYKKTDSKKRAMCIFCARAQCTSFVCAQVCYLFRAKDFPYIGYKRFSLYRIQSNIGKSFVSISRAYPTKDLHTRGQKYYRP